MKIRVSIVVLPLVLVLLIGYVPQAAAGPSAAVQNDSMWIDILGYLHIVGEVKNTGDVWLRFVKIFGTLRDAGGGTVDVTFTYTLVRFVPPDNVVPFDLTEIDTAKSARVQSYSLVLEFDETGPPIQKLAVLNVADSKNLNGQFEVVGEVENQGDKPAPYTHVIGTFYDAGGKVVYADFTYTEPTEIPPRAKHGFKITVLSDTQSSKITRYTLIAESENAGYTSVPEWPSPILVAGIALSLAVIVIRRKRR
jgi:hypothetical protein